MSFIFTFASNPDVSFILIFYFDGLTSPGSLFCLLKKYQLRALPIKSFVIDEQMLSS